MKKSPTRIILIVIAVVVGILVVILVLGRFVDIPILQSVPVVKEVACGFPVRVQGDSMSPAIKDGTLANFDRCIENPENIATGTIIVYDLDGQHIGRIESKRTDNLGVHYTISRDNRPDEESVGIQPDMILGILAEE